MNPHPRSFTLIATVIVATLSGWILPAAPQKSSADRDVPPPRRAIKPPPADPAPPPAVAPITFADPDGQELLLEELSARAVIHGMLSLTEVELRFRNPTARRMEGRFTFALPRNAAISRFAYEINGQLMEGEVVERLRANQVYEQFLHQMRDPALLEQDQGNRFSARIFPIAPNAPVRLLLSYTSLLPAKDGVRTYALALRGMQEVGKLTFRAFSTPLPAAQSVGGMSKSAAEVTSFEQNDWTPDRDIVITEPAGDGPVIVRAGDYYVAALQPGAVRSEARAASGRWLFYVDTSASSAEGAAHRIRALEGILRALPPHDSVQLLAFDNEVAPLARGTASELSRTAGDALRERLFLGGTNLGAVLRDVATQLRNDNGASVVIASDLVATLGTTTSHEVQNAIDTLPAAARVDALILGNREDAVVARALTKGRGRIIRVPFTESIDMAAMEAAEQLQRPVGASIDVADASAEWIHPSRFDDVAPGDEILVLGHLKPGAEPQIGTARTVRIDASTFAPLLEREAYRAYLDYLAEREAKETSDAVRRALATEQVKISIERRVVIPRTTMLVLETEWDYQRFGLDRRALSEILTIEAGGIGRIDRRAPAWGGIIPMDAPQRIVPLSQKAVAQEVAAAEAPQAADFAATAPPPPPMPAPPPAFGAVTEIAAADAAKPRDAVVGGVVGGVASAPAIREERRRRRPIRDEHTDIEWTRTTRPDRDEIGALQGKLRDNPRDRELYNLLGEALAAHSEWSRLRTLALEWQPYDPENPQVYEVLGLAASELGRRHEAARAFASLIEVAPAKPELLQRAGLLLMRIGRGEIAEAPLRRALELRPDRANAYRHLALILWQEGRLEEAARVLESATRQQFPAWYGNVHRVIREELGYVYRAWAKNDAAQGREIEARARDYDVDLDRHDALRITLAWETDANDVDLHVVDPDGEQCFYDHRHTSSGLTLHEDITQGLGPEVVRTAHADRGTYHVGVRYFTAGPMGISRGVVVVMRDDEVEIHPFRLTTSGGPVRYVTAVRMK